MPTITFVSHDGKKTTVNATKNRTIMEIALEHAIPHIEAECGGACSCATCHVYIDSDWTSKTGHPEPMEEDMLDFAFDVRDTSRLSCQIKMTEELDGLVVHVPEKQA